MTLTVQLASGDALGSGADALIVAVFAGKPGDQAGVRALEDALGGGLITHLEGAEFEGKAEQLVEVPSFGRIKSRRLLLLGLGAEKPLDAAKLRAAVATAVRSAQTGTVKTIALALPSAALPLRTVGEGVILGAYRFTRYFTGERKPKAELAKVTLFAANKPSAEQRRALETGVAIGNAVGVARDAVNEPPNELVPETLAVIARRLAKAHGFKVKVLDKPGIAAAGMQLHYAVGQGSANEPRFIHLTYTPKKKSKKKVVFVGKGLTFDSGGLCIKPAPGMGEMKSDMAGAAAVLGLMDAVGTLAPDIEVHGIVGAAENMPDGSAYRPADVFGSLGGKTVEIINTDAEGRLVLADALAYAANLQPDLIVDAATLTGAALVALGKTCSAFYATDDELARSLLASAEQAGEAFWRMPLLEELGEQLKSDIADLKHTGERWGGSITAALFLKEFIGKVPWLHCDIAGPVLAERARGTSPKGATGHAVLTFVSLVERLAAG